MKTITFSFILGLATTLSAVGQTTIAHWTFETSVPAATDQASISGIAAEIGTGTASGLHANAATDYSNPVGNGSLESLSANDWAIGDYYQFQVSTLGLTDIQISWQQTRSSTGPATWDLAYSLDGTSFTIAQNDYTVNQITWSSTTFTNASAFTADLSAVDSLENAPSVFFRVIADAAPSSAAGTARVDDVQIVAVPEPSHLFLLGGLALLGGRVIRRRFQR